MSNSYCTADQAFVYHDRRSMLELSGDKNSPEGVYANVTAILDACAARVDSYLTGRVTVPPTSTAALALLQMMVADYAADRLWGRRESRPKALDTALKRHDDWLEMFAKGQVQLPGTDRAAVPQLHVSDSTEGASRFDKIYGLWPSDTGPTGGK